MASSLDRAGALASVVSASRVEYARTEQQRLQAFAGRLGLPVTVDTVSLYLTATESDHGTARGLRRRLAGLDLAEKLDGRTAWSNHPSLQFYLRGLHRDVRIGPTNERADPLYAELVQRLVDAVTSPTPPQLRDRATLTLTHATGLPAARIAALTWTDVSLNRTTATLHLKALTKPAHDARTITLSATSQPACPVLALRHLRAPDPHATGPVFSNTGKPWDTVRIHRARHALADAGGDIEAALAAVSVSPYQLRDRAILLIGYGAALRTTETVALTRADITTHQHGLLIHVPDRTHPAALPAAPGAADDPVNAWATWADSAAQQGHGHPHSPAFPIVSGTRIWDRPIREMGLNNLVQDAAARAQLEGRYTYTSLRTGLIRTALRADSAAVDIAAHSDLTSLTSVARHERRENLIRRSVAGRLGL